jgi:hypothetical protein
MENNLKAVPLEDLQLEVIEELNDTQEMPQPQEPSVEEQIKMATEELERKNNDLIQQIYYKEQEIKELRAVLDSQEQNFNKVIAGLCITIFGGR